MGNPYYDFTRCPRIYFRPNLDPLDHVISEFGNRILFITGPFYDNNFWSYVVQRTFEDNNVDSLSISINQEPNITQINYFVDQFRNERIDMVIAMGGGSVIDAGKAISGMLRQKGSVSEYLEDVGDPSSHSGVKVPFISIPTTSGSGSEATDFAIIGEAKDGGFKRALRHVNFMPDISIVNYLIPVSCTPEVKSACGMEALTQLLEAFISRYASEISDLLAYSGLKKIANNLMTIGTTDNGNIRVWSEMGHASLLSGMCLNNAGGGVVQSIATVIGGMFNIPYGAICGSLLGAAIKVNLELLDTKTIGKRSDTRQRYARVGELFSESKPLNEKASCSRLLETIEIWIEKLNIPRLSKYGIHPKDIPRIIDRTNQGNSPVDLPDEALASILLSRI